MDRVYAARRRRNGIMMALSLGATLLGLGWLVAILSVLLWEGFSGLSLAVFTEMTPPPGSAGGLLNPIVGSLILTGLAVLIGTPIGMLAGTYMAEYGRHDRLTAAGHRPMSEQRDRPQPPLSRAGRAAPRPLPRTHAEGLRTGSRRGPGSAGPTRC